MPPKGVSYISDVAGFKDNHYGFGVQSGTRIEGESKLARIQKDLLKSTRSEVERFDLALYTAAIKHNLLGYKDVIMSYAENMEKLRYKNPLAMLYAMSVVGKGKEIVDKKKFSELFRSVSKEEDEGENEGENEEDDEGEGKEEKKTEKRIINGVRDVDVYRYCIYIKKVMASPHKF